MPNSFKDIYFMKAVVLTVLFAILVPPVVSHAASFDCEKAKVQVEKMICSDDALGAADEIMSKYYFKVLKSLSNDRRSQLIEDQKLWLRNREESCFSNDDNCLRLKYAERIDALRFQFESHTPFLDGKMVDKTNADFPISDLLKKDIFELTGMLKKKKLTNFKSILEAFFNSRAASCIDEIIKLRKLEDGPINKESCLKLQDENFSKTIFFLKIGVYLSMPPLMPIPKRAPSVIASSGYIRGDLQFAQAAGVVLWHSNGAKSARYELTDFNSKKYAVVDAEHYPHMGFLSPNGRIFTLFDTKSDVYFFNSIDGSLIGKAPLKHGLLWLDDHTAVYSKEYKTFLVDFDTGKEISMDIMGLNKALATRRVKNEYTLYAGNKIVKIQVLRSNSSLNVKVISSYESECGIWTLNNSGVSADGKSMYCATGAGDFIQVSFWGGKITKVSLPPIHIQSGWPSPDPDKIIFMGFKKPIPKDISDPTLYFIYSLSQHTLSPIDVKSNNWDRSSAVKFLYYLPLNKQIVVEDRRLVFLDELPLINTALVKEPKDFSMKAIH